LSDNYTVTVTDKNGCTTDSSFLLPQEISVNAQFIANPESGFEPLNVQFTNTTQNATDYEWYIDGAFWDNTTHTSTYFDTAGIYNVMLYTYNNNPECLDSFALNIIVEDTMTVRIPNVFTPNGDFSNDEFTIDVRRANEIHAIILNRWGNVMHETTEQSNGTNQTITIWDGNSQSNPATEGTYFYKFDITDVKGEVYVYQGFFHLVRD
ncbi:MAG: gliding motility-associated C-terminal domain-containing protein, partial [Brumimicrobium sp.]|nr:gliding motility-associated C-terminal domain-containing protein [Brumimicrobium sp.]